MRRVRRVRRRWLLVFLIRRGKNNVYGFLVVFCFYVTDCNKKEEAMMKVLHVIAQKRVKVFAYICEINSYK